MRKPEETWTREEKGILKKLNTPYRIQEYLDNLEYNSTSETRSPRWIIRNKRSHCMEGALLAAACLGNIGYPPMLVDLRAENDDDHVIAVFKVNQHWGAVAKSNFTTLRYREPVYRNLRELSMSYFDLYFNSIGEKTLRSYSLPHNLSKFDDMNWRTTDGDLEDIGYYLESVRHYPLITSDQVKKLEIVSPLLLKGSLLGSNPEGLFIPGSKKKTKE